MLLQSFFIVDSTNYDNVPDIEMPANAVICFKVSTNRISELRSFYKKLFLVPKNYTFCLLISVEHELSSGDLNRISDFAVSCSFHLQYLKIDGNAPFILFQSNNGTASSYLSAIAEEFKAQGYDDIDAIFLDDSKHLSPEQGRYLVLNTDDVPGFCSQYLNSISTVTSADLVFLFFLHNPNKLREIFGVIEQAEVTMAKQLPHAYHLLKESSSLAAEKRALLGKIELLQEQLDSVNNYHFYYNASDTRYRRQITELLTFYKTEYEILPLWYKRFGHIIKVIMGKRSFRSLFDDNVKKYKD